jgi:hypothetical protein
MLSSKRTAAGTLIGSTHRINPAPEAVFQSPKPQPHPARASDGHASSNSLTTSRSKWATVTISRTISGVPGKIIFPN